METVLHGIEALLGENKMSGMEGGVFSLTMVASKCGGMGSSEVSTIGATSSKIMGTIISSSKLSDRSVCLTSGGVGRLMHGTLTGGGGGLLLDKMDIWSMKLNDLLSLQ